MYIYSDDNFQVGVADLSTSSRQLLSQLEAVCDLLHQLTGTSSGSDTPTMTSRVTPTMTSRVMPTMTPRVTPTPTYIDNNSPIKNIENNDMFDGARDNSRHEQATDEKTAVLAHRMTVKTVVLPTVHHAAASVVGLDQAAVGSSPKKSDPGRFRIRPTGGMVMTVGTADVVSPPVWRQVGAELGTIADSLTVGRRPVSGVFTAMPVAHSGRGFGTSNDAEEDSSTDDGLLVVRGSWEAVEAVSGLLLAVMVRAVIFVCLSRLKKSMC